jgi:exopolysaccharide production protein ExoQ
MSKASTHSFEPGGGKSSTWMIDKYLIVPILACVYALIAFPLILATCSPTDKLCLFDARPENKIFWPMVATIAVGLAVRDRSRLTLPPHIICLFAYLAFAGLSVLWAFKPELAFIRFSQQAMIIAAIVLPAMLAARTADLMRGLFLCFAFASVLNVFFVLGRPPIDLKFATWGYPGYFAGKNYLGYCAAVALLLSLHEVLYSGLRRVLGIIVALIAISLLFLSNSKTSLGLVVFVPFLAGLTLIAKRLTRLSPAIILLSILIGYLVLASVSGFNLNRLSYMLYGDSTFTGRTIIWDFSYYEIARRPLLGWGYQSFWLAGPDAPSIVDAKGWVKDMPNSHNGYLDTILEVGYVGLGFLVVFIIATLHAIGRVADRDPARAWLVLSLALFVILYNFLESLWMRGFEFLWVVFVMVAVEAGRYWKSSTAVAYRTKRSTPGNPGSSRGALRPR